MPFHLRPVYKCLSGGELQRRLIFEFPQCFSQSTGSTSFDIMDQQSWQSCSTRTQAIPTSTWKTVSAVSGLFSHSPHAPTPKASLAPVMRYDHQTKRPVWVVLCGRCRCKINAHPITSLCWLYLGVTLCLPKWEAQVIGDGILGVD